MCNLKKKWIGWFDSLVGLFNAEDFFQPVKWLSYKCEVGNLTSEMK